MKFEQPTIGVLGGGQLGRMLLPPANYLDLKLWMLDPNEEASCAELANEFVVGDFNNYEDVLAFGQQVDVVTIEIEHVNVDALYALEEAGKRVYPQPRVIETIQDKRKQKQFYVENDIPTSPFVLIDKKEDLAQFASFYPAFQKIGKGGYDGGGVQFLKSVEDVDAGFDGLSLLEKAVAFEKEIAIIVARNEQGEVELFPTVEMVFHPEHNLVDYLVCPADLPPEVNQRAREIAQQTAEAFGIIGLLAVELFVLPNGEVLVNECAPRPHNSGHQTIQGATVSQFEQLLRAITGLPLGKTKLIQPSAMVNILGAAGETGEAKVYGLDKVLAEEGIHVVLYGKRQTKPHRKMGHVTILGASREQLIKRINFVKQQLRIGI